MKYSHLRARTGAQRLNAGSGYKNGHSFGWSSEWLLSHASDLRGRPPLRSSAERNRGGGRSRRPRVRSERDLGAFCRVVKDLGGARRGPAPLFASRRPRRVIHPKQIGEKVRAYLANFDRGLRGSSDVLPYRRRERLTGVALASKPGFSPAGKRSSVAICSRGCGT